MSPKIPTWAKKLPIGSILREGDMWEGLSCWARTRFVGRKLTRKLNKLYGPYIYRKERK